MSSFPYLTIVFAGGQCWGRKTPQAGAWGAESRRLLNKYAILTGGLNDNVANHTIGVNQNNCIVLPALRIEGGDTASLASSVFF